MAAISGSRCGQIYFFCGVRLSSEMAFFVSLHKAYVERPHEGVEREAGDDASWPQLLSSCVTLAE